jgi:predicted ArsR family transcriptional regulator
MGDSIPHSKLVPTLTALIKICRKRKSITVQELTDKMGIAKAKVTSHLSYLYRMKLVNKTRSRQTTKDGKTHNIPSEYWPTDSGKKWLKEIK